MSADKGTDLVVANSEKYRTTNLVSGLPRTITVRYSGNYSSLNTAVTNAIARYNALGLRVTLQKVTGAANITVSDVSGQPYTASAGFPGGGNPHGSIKFNTA